jgi:hypothetical protein
METEYQFTKMQFDSLSEEEKSPILSILEYVKRETPSAITDKILSETLNLWRPTGLCVPEEEVGENLHGTVRYKYSGIYSPAIAAAVKELAGQGLSMSEDCSLRLVIDASFEDDTHVAVIDEKHLVCYDHFRSKAWHFQFEDLAALAQEFLRIKQDLVAKMRAKHTITVVLEGGIVQEVKNIPPGINIQVIDYDVEGADEVQVSPLDGEACVISQYSP